MLFQGNVLHTDCYCPACAIDARNRGIRVATKRWQLCKDHLGRLAAMLRSPYPDSTVLLFWAKYARARSAFDGTLAGNDGQ